MNFCDFLEEQVTTKWIEQGKANRKNKEKRKYKVKEKNNLCEA